MPASAYSGVNAARYADRWALRNNNLYPHFNSDCTNFVSQAVSNGGYPFRDPGGLRPQSWWFLPAPVTHSVPQYTTSWINVAAYNKFLMLDRPGGIPEGTARGSSTRHYMPKSMVTGDVIAYDWGKGEGLSHFAILVGAGRDPTSHWTGAYVDYHTTNRYHAFWSLRPYNSNWSTTKIYFIHIDARNKS